MPDDLGARLLRAGLVTRDQLGEMLASAPLHAAGGSGGALVAALVARGVAEDAIAGFFLAEGFGPLMDAEDLRKADPAALRRVPGAMAADLLALPVRASPAGLVVAMAAPSDRHAVRELARVVGGDVLPTVACVGALREAIGDAFPDQARQAAPPPAEAARPESEAPVLELVRRRAKEAVASPPASGAWGGSTRGEERAGAALGPRLFAEDDEPAMPLVRTKPQATPAGGMRAPSAKAGGRVITKNFARPDGTRKPPMPAAPTGAAAAPPGAPSGREDRGTADYPVVADDDAPPSAPPAAAKGRTGSATGTTSRGFARATGATSSAGSAAPVIGSAPTIDSALAAAAIGSARASDPPAPSVSAATSGAAARTPGVGATSRTAGASAAPTAGPAATASSAGASAASSAGASAAPTAGASATPSAGPAATASSAGASAAPTAGASAAPTAGGAAARTAGASAAPTARGAAPTVGASSGRAPSGAPRAASIVPPEHERWDVGGAPAAEARPGTPVGRRSGKLAPGRASAELPVSKAPPPEIGSVLSAMRGAKDRDEVVRLACEGAVTVARTAVFLALRKGVLKGWDAAGGGLSRDAVRNLWIPTTSASSFKRVVELREPHVGPYGTAVADGLFRAAVASRGGDAMFQPVVVGEKVVAVLCADDVIPAPLGKQRIEILAHAVGEAFRRILSDKR